MMVYVTQMRINGKPTQAGVVFNRGCFDGMFGSGIEVSRPD
jgi:hypothetical protein